eukprot:5802422-Lingulodinium_polyedra.AAC.1
MQPAQVLPVRGNKKGRPRAAVPGQPRAKKQISLASGGIQPPLRGVASSGTSSSIWRRSPMQSKWWQH